jgi:malate dehydrogenase
MKSVTEQVVKYSPNAIIIVLTNPVDAMTYVVYKTSGFPKERVIGQSGVLDTARFRTFVAQELNISVQDVTGFVLGGHGDDMVPLIRYSYAGGIPLEKWLPKDRLDAIVERTRKGGGEIVNLLGTGSAYYAPAASLVEMVEAILKDKRRILPAIAYLEGEYGYHDMYLGVPTILGGNGLERVIELDLTEEEKQALDKSAQSVRKVMGLLDV